MIHISKYRYRSAEASRRVSFICFKVIHKMSPLGSACTTRSNFRQSNGKHKNVDHHHQPTN